MGKFKLCRVSLDFWSFNVSMLMSVCVQTESAGERDPWCQQGQLVEGFRMDAL